MKYDSRILRLLSVIVLTLFLPWPVLSQLGSYHEPGLLEFGYTTCRRDSVCDDGAIYIYADGRYVSAEGSYEKSKSGRLRRVQTTHEKRLEPEELAELVSWAGQSDFAEAGPEYLVKRAQKHSSHMTITYRNYGRGKNITVVDFDLGTAEEKARVPPSVLKLMRWALPSMFP